MRHGFLPSNPELLARVPVHRFAAVGTPAPETTETHATATQTTPAPGGAALPVLDRSGVAFTPLAYDNTVVPDCVTACLGNSMRAVAALNGENLFVNAGKPVDWYAYLLGIIKSQTPPTNILGVPADLAALTASDGISPLTVLFALQSPGFNIGPSVVTGSFGLVVPSIEQLAAALCSPLGPGLWAFNLNALDVGNESEGTVWDTSPEDATSPVVAGHMPMAWDYTGLAPTDTVRLGTWGYWKRATWRWVLARMAEAYGVVLPSLAAPAWYAGLSADGVYVPL